MSGAGRSIADFLAAARGRVDRLDARLLLQHVAALTHAEVIAKPDLVLTSEQWEKLAQLAARRAVGEPLAYVLGEAEFRGRRYRVTPDVLIPRPETEGLVDLVLEKLHGMRADDGRPPRCVDLGTGSGIIAITVKLACPAAEVVAVDVSPAALAVAGGNAAALGAEIDFRAGSWYEPLWQEKYAVIVANPPYVAAGDPHLALNGLPYEPSIALTDGSDGLSCIRAIVGGASAHLRPGGWLLFEHGHDQGDASRNLLAAAGFESTFTRTDLAGIDRISGGRRNH